MFKIEISSQCKKNEVFYVYGHRSILAELEDYQIEIPHNCRQGHCGSCIMRLLKGEVRQKDNLVPLARDEILVCCAFPISDIRLESRQ